MSIGNNIKKIRCQLRMTQKELSEKCSISESAIRYYENNKRNPKIETLAKIAKALNVNIDTLTCNKSFDQELLNRVMNFTIPNDNSENLYNRFSLLGNSDNLEELTDFYEHKINSLSIKAIKGLLYCLSIYSMPDLIRVYEDLIQTNIYDLNPDIVAYCKQIYTEYQNSLENIKQRELDLKNYKTIGSLSLFELFNDEIYSFNNHAVNNAKSNENAMKMPNDFDAIISLLKNPNIQSSYSFSYSDLTHNGYEYLLYNEIRNVIKRTLEEIKEHEKNDDIFDGNYTWITKDSPIYQILKQHQK